jgi:hypothetical protein
MRGSTQFVLAQQLLLSSPAERQVANNTPYRQNYPCQSAEVHTAQYHAARLMPPDILPVEGTIWPVA